MSQAALPASEKRGSAARHSASGGQSQNARSFELRAALSLAKLYRATNRDADAHAVLAPAVEGFPPTQQFPELTEAQSLLAAPSRQRGRSGRGGLPSGMTA